MRKSMVLDTNLNGEKSAPSSTLPSCSTIIRRRGRQASISAMSAPEKLKLDAFYQNCWMIVHSHGTSFEKHTARKKSTALMILEFVMREALEQSPTPGTISLYWFDDNGREHMLSRSEINHHIERSA